MQNVLPMILEPPRALRPQAEKPAPFIGAVEQERHRGLIRSRCALDRIGQHGRYPVVTADHTPNEKAPPGSRQGQDIKQENSLQTIHKLEVAIHLLRKKDFLLYILEIQVSHLCIFLYICRYLALYVIHYKVYKAFYLKNFNFIKI